MGSSHGRTQSSLFQVFNTLVRASAEAREAVLQYFARAINLNRKRSGMQVDMLTVSSDSFIMNLQIILLQFCEPFMDAQYSKVCFALCGLADVENETCTL